MNRAFNIIDALSDVANERGTSIAQVALNWLLSKPGVTSVIVGARNREQLLDNLATASWSLTDGEVHRFDEISALPLPYPYFHQQGENLERMFRHTGTALGNTAAD